MRRAVTVGVAALALVFPDRARAAYDPAELDHPDSLLPQSSSGLLSILGGVRYPFPNALEQGITLTSQSVAPAVMLPFGYQVDRTWAIFVELGYSAEKLTLAGSPANGTGTLSLSTFTIQLGSWWTPDIGLSRLQPMIGGGFGYYLSTVGTSETAAISPPPQESNTTGIFASVGLRFAVTERFGLILEDRYAFAATGAGNLGSLSVGGNTTALGMYLVWKQ